MTPEQLKLLQASPNLNTVRQRLQPRGAQASPVTPTLLDMLGGGISQGLESAGISPSSARNVGQGLADVADFATPFGTGTAIDDAVRAAGQGDAFGVGMGMMSAIPIVGKSADKIYDITKNLKADSGYTPQKTQKAYKLFRTKKGSDELYPLFVNANDAVPVGKWTDAVAGEKAASGKVKSKLGDLAYRAGWHAGDAASAQHIGGKATKGAKKPQYRPANQVWAEVEMPADVDWQSEAMNRAKKSKSGEIIPRTAEIKDQVPFGGFYRYKTNPNMQGQWLISGNMKVNNTLDNNSVKRVAQETGIPDLPTLPEFIDQNNIGLGQLNQVALKELQDYYPDYYSKKSGK